MKYEKEESVRFLKSSALQYKLFDSTNMTNLFANRNYGHENQFRNTNLLRRFRITLIQSKQRQTQTINSMN